MFSGAIRIPLIGIAGLAHAQLRLQPTRIQQPPRSLVANGSLQSEGVVSGSRDATSCRRKLACYRSAAYAVGGCFFQWKAP